MSCVGEGDDDFARTAMSSKAMWPKLNALSAAKAGYSMHGRPGLQDRLLADLNIIVEEAWTDWLDADGRRLVASGRSMP